MRSVGLVISLVVLLSSWIGASLAAEPLPTPKGPVLLTVSGNVKLTNAPGAAQFDREMLEAFQPASLTTRSAWSEGTQLFEGVSLRAILERVGAEGQIIRASALNAYEAEIPFSDLQYEPLLAMRLDGQPLKMRDKGPLWLVYPRDAHDVLQDVIFDTRWVWQLNRLHID